MILASCGHSDSFRIKGTVDDGASLNIRLVYYADGAVRTGLTAATDGKFEFEGNSPQVAAVEVYDNDYRILARFLAKNGQDINLKINRANPFLSRADGNDENRLLTQFLNENADSLARSTIVRNRLIGGFVGSNPSSQASALLLATEFDASGERGKAEADSLLSLLTPEALALDIAIPFADLSSRKTDEDLHAKIFSVGYRTHGLAYDSLDIRRRPLSFITFSDDAHGRTSVVDALREASSLGHGIAILDLSLDADTIVWIRAIRNDSATWTQGWLPGAISNKSASALAVPSLPYFIIADSAGSQLWRGSSPDTALEQLRSLNSALR